MAVENDTLTPEQFGAEWDRMAAERDGDDPSPAPAPDTTDADTTAAQPAAATAPAPAPVADPFASLPPEVREKLALVDQLQRTVAQTQNEFRAAQGRIGTLQREFDVARQAAQTSASKPSDAQIAAAAKSPEKWSAMKNDFPEWADAIESMVESRLGAIKPNAQPAFDPAEIDRRVQQALTQERQVQQQRTQVETFVETKHPGWKSTVNSQQFAEWHSKLPPGLQRLADSPDANDAVALLDLYNAAKPASAPAAGSPPPVNDERKARLQAAANTKPGVTPPRKSEDDMSFDELWDHEAKLRQKRDPQTGRFR